MQSILTESVNYGGDCKTAPATQGLLTIIYTDVKVVSQHYPLCLFNNVFFTIMYIVLYNVMFNKINNVLYTVMYTIIQTELYKGPYTDIQGTGRTGFLSKEN